jgi:hypothetical protein
MFVRRSIVFLSSLLLVISLVACGGSDKKSAAKSDPTAQSGAGTNQAGDGSDASDKNLSLSDKVCKIILDQPDSVRNDPKALRKVADELRKIDPPADQKKAFDDWIDALDEAGGKPIDALTDDPKLAGRVAQGFLQFGLKGCIAPS